MSLISTATATIAASGSLSAEVDIFPSVLVGIYLPSNWTSAPVTFQASPDGGVTWGELYNYAAGEVTFTGTTAQFVQVDPTQWKGVTALKLRSGTPGAPVAQSSQVAVTLVLRQMVA